MQKLWGWDPSFQTLSVPTPSTMIRRDEAGTCLDELSAGSAPAPRCLGLSGFQSGGPSWLPIQGETSGAPVPTQWSLAWMMRPPQPGCPSLLLNGSASSPLFLGDERRGAINRHGAECLRRSGAVRTSLVKALVLTAGSRLLLRTPTHHSPGREGLPAGRTPHSLLPQLAVSGPLPPSLTHAGVCEAAPALSAWLTPSLSPGPRGLHA